MVKFVVWESDWKHECVHFPCFAYHIFVLFVLFYIFFIVLLGFNSKPQALNHDGRRQDRLLRQHRLLSRTQRLLRDATSIMRRCEQSCGIRGRR